MICPHPDEAIAVVVKISRQNGARVACFLMECQACMVMFEFREDAQRFVDLRQMLVSIGPSEILVHNRSRHVH